MFLRIFFTALCFQLLQNPAYVFGSVGEFGFTDFDEFGGTFYFFRKFVNGDFAFFNFGYNLL